MSGEVKFTLIPVPCYKEHTVLLRIPSVKCLMITPDQSESMLLPVWIFIYKNLFKFTLKHVSVCCVFIWACTHECRHPLISQVPWGLELQMVVSYLRRGLGTELGSS